VTGPPSPFPNGHDPAIATAGPADAMVAPDSTSRRSSLISALVVLAAVACAVLALLVLQASRVDPYTSATLDRVGSVEDGGRLFRLNCAGCHGLAAQGLVGPNLHRVDRRKNDRQLIQQVVSGRTPPMPRFQPDPQAMADLLAFLHSLP